MRRSRAAVGPGFIGRLGMKAAERAECRCAQRLPVRGRSRSARRRHSIASAVRGQRAVLSPARPVRRASPSMFSAVGRLLEQRRRYPPRRACARAHRGTRRRSGERRWRAGATGRAPAAADRVPRLRVTHDEAVAGHRSRAAASKTSCTRADSPAASACRFQRHDVGHAMGGPEVQVHRRPRRYGRAALAGSNCSRTSMRVRG